MAAQPSIAEACTLTVNDYAWYLDHPGLDPARGARSFAGLFTPDAELTRPDDDLAPTTRRGREAIAENYLDNRTDTRFLHVTSNIRIVPTSGNTATGTSYLTTYMHAATGSMKDEGAVRMIEEARDDYLVTADGCRISRRRSVLRFLSIDGVIQAPDPE